MKCNFCGYGCTQVRTLIAGPNIFICDECISLATHILAQEKDIIWQMVYDDSCMRRNQPVPSTPRNRPSWDDYFMHMCDVVRLRSPDPRTQVGAVLVTDDNRIVSTGYNGFPCGVSEATIDWSNRDEVYKRIVHAEVNALLYASSRFKNAKLYCTFSPCSECLKLLAGAGVVRVMFKIKYKDFEDVHALAQDLGVSLLAWPGSIRKVVTSDKEQEST